MSAERRQVPCCQGLCVALAAGRPLKLQMHIDIGSDAQVVASAGLCESHRWRRAPQVRLSNTRFRWIPRAKGLHEAVPHDGTTDAR